MMCYRPAIAPEHLTFRIRDLDYRVYRWGEEAAEPVFLLHGFADTAMSFQFLADTLAADWCLIAPDLQGFGNSAWNPRGYWFPDYLADLDALLEQFSPRQPARLVGHSMGGNIACHYAGIFPDRVSHLVSLDAFGMPDSSPEEAPDRFAQWLRQWRSRPAFSEYDELSAYEEIIRKRAPHLARDRARFLAEFWGRATAGGRYTSKTDPAHKLVNPILYRRAEAKACWRRISAWSMLVLGADSWAWERYYRRGMREDFFPCFRYLRELVIRESGHMLHLDQPEILAETLHDFLQETRVTVQADPGTG